MQKELLYYKEAEENLLAAIRADPSVPDPYRVLAILYQYVYFDLTKAAMYHNAVLAAEPNGR
jgi:Tfp pilus assembly protein PilF